MDSLRGLAAFTVVLHHFYVAYGFPRLWYITPLVDGQPAVLFFFVLSGFVLSLSFWAKGQNDRYSNFLARRIFRIYVPYLGAVALAAVAAIRYAGRGGPLTSWYYRTWDRPVTPMLVLRHLWMGGGTSLDTAFWSLRYEVQISIIFPLLLLLLSAMRPWVAVVGAIAIFPFLSIAIDGGMHDPHLLLETVKYGLLFVAGATLARCLAPIRAGWDRASKVTRIDILVVSLILYFGVPDRLLYKFNVDTPSDLLPSIGACALMISAMYTAPLRRLLQLRIPSYLGRISYSMYLVHGTVLFTLLNLIYGKVRWPVFALIYLASTLVFSHLFCILIEEPSLRLGKRFAGRWKGQAV